MLFASTQFTKKKYRAKHGHPILLNNNGSIIHFNNQN